MSASGDVARLARALASGRVSSERLARRYLERIAATNPDTNCYITVTEDDALAAAADADARLGRGAAGAVTGIPIAVKDLFCTAGTRTSCASRMLESFIAPYDATAVRMLRGAGMVLLGKTNMDEFAMGSSNETSHYGPVPNPWDPERVAGGSSGGSAAVATGLAPVALGTDTGGSVRQPAALCGVTGLKPTYGRISRYGMVAYASSLDQAGVIAHSAADIAPVLESVAGFDPRDSTSADRPVDAYRDALDQDLSGLRVGVPAEYFGEGLDPRVGAVVRESIAALGRLGADVREIRLDNAHLAIPAYYVIAPAECSSNLARYDGVRYGYRSPGADTVSTLYERTRAEGFGAEVKRRILIGTYVLSAGYYDAYYLKAQKVRRLIRDDFQRAFAEVDIIAGPTSPTVAFALGERTADPVSMYLSDIYTISVNLAGLCAMSVPAGFVDGLPVGLQLIGNYFDEATVLRAGHQYQQATDWHLRRPPGYVDVPALAGLEEAGE